MFETSSTISNLIFRRISFHLLYFTVDSFENAARGLIILNLNVIVNIKRLVTRQV